jgi:hypothetical protein
MRGDSAAKATEAFSLHLSERLRGGLGTAHSSAVDVMFAYEMMRRSLPGVI